MTKMVFAPSETANEILKAVETNEIVLPERMSGKQFASFKAHQRITSIIQNLNKDEKSLSFCFKRVNNDVDFLKLLSELGIIPFSSPVPLLPFFTPKQKQRLDETELTSKYAIGCAYKNFAKVTLTNLASKYRVVS